MLQGIPVTCHLHDYRRQRLVEGTGPLCIAFIAYPYLLTV